MIKFPCPKCQQIINAPDIAKGRRYTCPYCSYQIDRVQTDEMDRDENPGVNEPKSVDISDHVPVIEKTEKFILEEKRLIPKSLLIFLYATVITFLFSILLIWSQKTFPGMMSITAKFIQRGWTPFAASFLFFWSTMILIEKIVVISKRKTITSVQLIPDQIDFERQDEIAKAISYVRAEAKEHKDSLLSRRIARALEHYGATRNIKEVGDILNEESDSAFSTMELSYTVIRVSLWAIPILGFIGTVIGVGDAVGGFASFLSSVHEIEEIKTALSTVTTGLSVAFDTTFVALVLSVILMLIMTSVEKMERDQLLDYERYAQNNVLRRLSKLKMNYSRRKDMHSDHDEEKAGLLNKKHLESFYIELNRLLTSSIQKPIEELNTGLHDYHKIAFEREHNMLLLIDKSNHDRVDSIDRIDKLARLNESNNAQLLRELHQVIEKAKSSFEMILDRQYQTLEKQDTAIVSTNERNLKMLALYNQFEEKLSKPTGMENIANVIADLRQLIAQLEPVLRKLSEKPIDVKVKLIASEIGNG